MPNMPLYKQASLLREKFPTSSLGIHWNLTQGRPILDGSRISSLVGADRMFLPNSIFRRRWLLGKINPKEVSAELRAQYLCFRDVIGYPIFWNTHENMHVLPGLFQKCVGLAKELGIRGMRCHRRFTVLPSNQALSLYYMRNPGYWLKGKIIDKWSQKAEEKGMCMPDGRIYLKDGEMNSSSILKSVMSINWNAVRNALEFIIHPASRIDEELFGDITQKRVLEYQVFKDPDLVKKFQNCGIEVVGFEALGFNV